MQYLVILWTIVVLLCSDASAQFSATRSQFNGAECAVPMLQAETLGPPGKDRLVVTVQPNENGQLRMMYGTSPSSLTTESQPEICSETGPDWCAAPGTTYAVNDDELAAFKMLTLTPGTKYYYQVQCRPTASDPWTKRGIRWAWTMPNASTTYKVYGWGDEQNAMAWGCSWDPWDWSNDTSYANSKRLVMEKAAASSDPSFFLSLGDTFMINQCNAGSYFCTGSPPSRTPCKYNGEDISAGRLGDVGTNCCVIDDFDGANAAGNARRGELAILSLLHTFRPLQEFLPVIWAPGNHDLGFPQEQRVIGAYAEGHEAEVTKAKRRALFNVNESSFYPGTNWNDKQGREFCVILGDALWCQINPYSCTCATDCEPGDPDSNLPQTPDDWEYCSGSKTEVANQISAFGGKYVIIVHHQGAWGVNGIDNRSTSSYGRGEGMGVERRCLDADGNTIPGDGGFQCQHNDSGGLHDCVTGPGSPATGASCQEINPTGLLNNAAGQWLQSQLEGFIAGGGEWAFVLSGHNHADFTNCKLNASGVCSKVVYSTWGMPSKTKVTWPWVISRYGNEYFDADRDGQQDTIVFYTGVTAGHPDEDLTGANMPHGVVNGSHVGGPNVLTVSATGVTLEKFVAASHPAVERACTEMAYQTHCLGDKIIDLSFPITHTPVSVAIGCSSDGSGGYDCTATPSGGVDGVEYLWDCDGDWSFSDEPAAVKGLRPFGWHTENTMNCPSGQIQSPGEIHVLVEEMGGPLQAVDTFDVP
jgi:hypothetical protein